MSLFSEKIGPSLLGKEGGYANHPSDRGGETMWGITIATARKYGYHGPMRSMPRDTALAIYEKRYYVEPGFAAVAGLNEAIALELTDTGVNMGPAVASEFLQVALNAFNRRGKDYADIAVDRDIGPATLGALKAFLRFRGAQGVTVMLRALNAQQGARYLMLGQQRPANEDFMFGWFANRVS